jgi:hypothetical protein
LVVSASALSNESATVPIEGRAPISSSRSVNRTLVNWPVSIGGRNAGLLERA